MNTAARIPPVVLSDRWDSVMFWERTGGDASPQYLALVAALGDLVDVVAGVENADISEALDEITLCEVREVIVDAVERAGIAR